MKTTTIVTIVGLLVIAVIAASAVMSKRYAVHYTVYEAGSINGIDIVAVEYSVTELDSCYAEGIAWDDIAERPFIPERIVVHRMFEDQKRIW